MASVDQTDRLALRDLDREQAELPSADVVAHGRKVTLHFALKLKEGDIVDSNFEREPVSFVIGDGNMLPGFESALLGLRQGQSVEVTVPAAQAFGEGNPDNQQRFPRYHFPPDMALSENLMIEFTDASGYKQAGRVLSIGTRDVEIDFNHPLAGRDILFCARVYKVEEVAGSAANTGSN